MFAPTHQQFDLTTPRVDVAQLGRFDIVMHFASTGVRSRADDPDIVLKERAMAAAVLPLTAEGGVFVYAGSVSEYGHSGRLREDSVCTPRNFYARAKLETGQWLRDVGRRRGIAVRVLRIFGAFGPGEGSHRLFPQLITSITDGNTINLSDGMQIRDFVFVKDVAKAALEIALKPASPDCINVGTGTGLRVRDVIRWLASELGADPELLKFGARNRSLHDLDELVADTSRLSHCIGWVPPQRIKPQESIFSLITQGKVHGE